MNAPNEPTRARLEQIARDGNRYLQPLRATEAFLDRADLNASEIDLLYFALTRLRRLNAATYQASKRAREALANLNQATSIGV
jgi:hypothetical protein